MTRIDNVATAMHHGGMTKTTTMRFRFPDHSFSGIFEPDHIPRYEERIYFAGDPVEYMVRFPVWTPDSDAQDVIIPLARTADSSRSLPAHPETLGY